MRKRKRKKKKEKKKKEKERKKERKKRKTAATTPTKQAVQQSKQYNKASSTTKQTNTHHDKLFLFLFVCSVRKFQKKAKETKLYHWIKKKGALITKQLYIPSKQVAKVIWKRMKQSLLTAFI